MRRSLAINLLAACLGVTAVMLLALYLAFRPDPPPEMPPLTRDLPASQGAAETTFQQRLRERFTPRSSEDDMIAELKRQGFQVWPEHRMARFEWSQYSCAEFWQVLWAAEAGRIIALTGARGRICM